METITQTIRVPIYITISYDSNAMLEWKLEEIENSLENVEYVMGVGMDDMEVVS